MTVRGLRDLQPPRGGEMLGEEPVLGAGGVPRRRPVQALGSPLRVGSSASLAGCILDPAVSRPRASLPLYGDAAVQPGRGRPSPHAHVGRVPDPRACPQPSEGAQASPAAPACLCPPPALPASPSLALPQRLPLGASPALAPLPRLSSPLDDSLHVQHLQPELSRRRGPGSLGLAANPRRNPGQVVSRNRN